MELMRTHGQLSVFIGVMIEQIIVPIPSPMIIMGAGAVLILPGLSVPNASPPDSVDHRSSRYNRIHYRILYRIYDQFLWREGIGGAVPAFSGCGLGPD